MSAEHDETAMPFLDHLSELRFSLARSLAAIVVGSIFCFLWANEIFHFLTEPLLAAFDKATLIGTGPAEAFIVKLKVALTAGIILTSPVSFYELWNFVSPGLYQHERKFALPFVFFSTFFFILGISFCFYFVLPFAFQFFMSEFISIGIAPTIKIGEYLSFIVKLLLVFGIVFELPIFSFFLARVGLLTSDFLIRNSRYSIVIIFIVAAILTPPDVITQTLLAIPLTLLYAICILVTRSVEKARSANN